MNFQQENDYLLKSFLKRTFFDNWRTGNKDLNFGSVEIELFPHCNLGCKYCYFIKNANHIYPKEIRDEDTMVKNVGIFIDWLQENGYNPNIDIFSGEPLSQEIGYRVLDVLYDKYKNALKKPTYISIPTNYTFLLDDNLIKRVEDQISKFASIGIRIALSASVDGLYMEDNRPIVNTKDFIVKEKSRDQSFYDKLFAFNKKHFFGFHPMVYSSRIEYWKQNFLWFQENFKKYDIPFFDIYLLEVRNKEWTVKQMAEFSDFIRFLMVWTFENVLQSDKDKFMDFIFKYKGYNILASSLSQTGRGLGCSLQSMLYVRMGDLNIIPCHRTAYKGKEVGQFQVYNNKIIDIKAKNPEIGIGVISLEGKAQPQCETCLIKYNCTLGCLGSQFEANGDEFSPIPTVCQLEHAKMLGLVKGAKEIGIWPRLKKYSSNNSVLYALPKLEQLIIEHEGE
jgi:radical SAM protein with 4Fe4S-binding SPASM domain